jgi:hypothetical protein
MRSTATNRFRWGLLVLWFGAAITSVLTHIASVAASRYLRPETAMLTVIPIMIMLSLSFVVLLAVPVIALLARSVKMLPEIRRAIEWRDFEWAERLLTLARRTPRIKGTASAWNVEVDCLEGAIRYYQSDYQECMERVAPVFAWAGTAGDVALARESGYFLLASAAALQRHYDVLTISARVEPYYTLHNEPYDVRRLAQVRYLAAQSLAELDRRTGASGWVEAPAEA